MSRNGYIQVDVIQPVCPRCGSTKRSKYHTQREHFNVVVRGVRYGKIKLRRTTCNDCGQNRVERVLYQEKPKTTALRDKVSRKPAEAEQISLDSLSSEACTPSSSYATESLS